jgi:hypothetical protein
VSAVKATLLDARMPWLGLDWQSRAGVVVCCPIIHVAVISGLMRSSTYPDHVQARSPITTISALSMSSLGFG